MADEASEGRAWQLFERDPGGYEAWYATPRGRRADRAERALLARLLAPFATARRALEIGCGTGHFTRWLAGRLPYVVGLDRAPAMLAEARRRDARSLLVEGDAHDLPLRSRGVDLAVFITTLEFLERPSVALAEAVRVSHRGVVVLALNRWSVGGFSRRWGADARGRRLVHARDFTPASLRALARAAAGPRLRTLRWASGLVPGYGDGVQAVLPFGDIIGTTVELTA
jgi:ubiquinone/menaquinone biosynthesis C-methylase UbiE